MFNATFKIASLTSWPGCWHCTPHVFERCSKDDLKLQE
jgi:hypothetical protein